MKHRILITGSIAYDLLLHYEGSFEQGLKEVNLEQLSVSFTTHHYERHFGGNGANIAWNLKLLLQNPLLVGTVGRDGRDYCNHLAKHSIDVSCIEQRDDDVTPTAIIATDSDERQITFFHSGADAKGDWPDLSHVRNALGYAIVSPRDSRIQMQAMQWCSQYHIPCLFDPGQGMLGMGPDEMRRALHFATGFIVNAYEWSLCADLLQASVDDVLQEVEYVVVTHGGEGCTIYTPESETVLPACKAAHVVNPTGAGDAFRAGFLTGMIGGWPLSDSAKLGAAIASKVVEQQGTLLDTLDLNEVLNRAAITYGKELPVLPVTVSV